METQKQKKIKNKKIIIVISSILLVLLFCSGCNQNSPEKLYGPFEKNELKDGCYILNEETNKCYSCVQDSRYKSDGVLSMSATEASPIVWFSNNRLYIPTLGKNCKLIMKTSENLPAISTLVQMVDYGTTLGVVMSRNFDPNVFSISTGDFALCEGSDASQVFANGKTSLGANSTNIRIVDIGGTKVNESMLTDMNTIQGLEEGKDYKITYYIGSQYHEVPVTADTHVFSTDVNNIKSISKYNYTKDGYVEIQIPENLEKGYYYINNSGIFYYNPEEEGGTPIEKNN